MDAEGQLKMLRWAHLPECEEPADGWLVRRFTDIAKVIAGQSPPSETYNDKGEGLPFLQGNADFSFKYPQASLWCTAPAKTAHAGDSLINVRAPVGEINRADREYAIGRGLAGIRATDSNSDFIYQALQRWRWCLQRVAQGTTFDAVTARHFSQLHVAVPQRPEEQAVIARVLDAVDTVLERTRDAVSSARVLRDSLINQLLRTGVHGERQKKSAVGWIPVSWNCEPLGQHISEGPTNGVYCPESDYGTKGTKIVRIDSFDDGRIHGLTALHRVNIKPVIERRYALARDDLLINRVNSLSHIGKAAIVPALDEPTVFESNMMSLRCDDQLLPEFLILVLCSDIARKHWLARAKPAVNQASINQRDVRELPVPVPHPNEQRDITRIVTASNAHLNKLATVADAQEALKRSLMHDLLTGRVRVKPCQPRGAILL